jgi:lipopolysaccharide transport system permease protein
MLTATAMDTVVTSEARNVVLELGGEPSFATRNRLAIRDVSDGTRLLPLAWTLGWLDIRLRYRGSMLGPLWLTLSTGIMVGALGYLYAGIFHIDVHDYLPYLALSLVLWGFLASVVSESCTAFTESEGIVRAVRMPFFLFAARLLIRNVLVLAHNILVIAVVYLVFQVWPGWHALLALPGLLLWALDALALVLLLGTFCARFRDILPIVASIIQIAFFMTPVIWKPEQLGSGQRLLPLNPFFDLLEIVRAPLLGTAPGARIWIGAGLCSFVLWGLAWSLFTRARGRIAFWI